MSGGDAPSALMLGQGAATNPAQASVLSFPVVTTAASWESVDIPTLKDWVGTGATGFLHPPATQPTGTAVATFTSGTAIGTVQPAGSNGQVLTTTATGLLWEAVPSNIPASILKIGPTITFSDTTTAPGGLSAVVVGTPGTGTAICIVQLLLNDWLPSLVNEPVSISLLVAGSQVLPPPFPINTGVTTAACILGDLYQAGAVSGISNAQSLLAPPPSGTGYSALTFVSGTIPQPVTYLQVNQGFSGLPMTISTTLTYVC